MNIAYIHYHLKPGGVTTVIRQQMEAISGLCRTLVLAGEVPSSWQIPAIPIPGIAYDQSGLSAASPEQTAEHIIKEIHSVWPEGCDIIHVHNPTLAKNINFLKILKILQGRGFNLLLQIHDFAEDGRPHSYFPETYPANCHYCVINTRDRDVLLHAGLTPQGLHLLPNMINPVSSTDQSCSLDNFILYPVRAIRRKNIGEAILLSLFFRNRETLAITLPPNSAADMKSYNGWKDFAARHDLPVIFEASSKDDFLSLMHGANFIITTSISEGFGFSFLEPWTAGQRLWGRNLPEICIDFQNRGVRLDGLYSRIVIPDGWIAKEELLHSYQTTIENSLKSFGCGSTNYNTAEGFAGFISRDGLDFGMLNERFQKQIIMRVLSSAVDKKSLAAANPFLRKMDTAADQAVVTHNRQTVLANYSQTAYRENMLKIYESVKQMNVVQSINKQKLLRRFLTPSRLNLLKWSTYE